MYREFPIYEGHIGRKLDGFWESQLSQNLTLMVHICTHNNTTSSDRYTI